MAIALFISTPSLLKVAVFLLVELAVQAGRQSLWIAFAEIEACKSNAF
jgi:hypothetical protein